MVKLIPPPAGVQDKLVYDYLYQLQEYLAHAPAALTASVPDAAVQAAAGKAASEQIAQQVQYLKALIIKTADTVEQNTQIDLSGLRALIEQLDGIVQTDHAALLTVQSDYVAQSEFGTYQEQVNQALSATSQYLEQYVQYVSELRSDLDAVSADFTAWRIRSEGYIRSGVVGYRDDTTPIIGIAIGQDLTVLQDANGDDVVVTVDGVDYNVVEQVGFRAIYAADELSFWQDDVKVACMSNRQLYITDVVALSRLRVGSWSMTDSAANGLVIKWEG